jgi:L-galactose dehydrogenase/L-glyceraldehyde 3-phosphate reductase
MIMNYRRLGKTNLQVSELGFGCGAVGGLLVKGDRKEMVRVVARAIEGGINYFDTAAIYGDGQSETSLGLVLEELKPAAFVGTKVRLLAEDLTGSIEQAVFHSVETSLKRLRRDYVDLIQLHNFVSTERLLDRRWVTPEDVESAMEAFRKLHAQGKVSAWGFNGLGETEAVHKTLRGSAQTMQACFNLLNPTAGWPSPDGYPDQDFGRSIQKAADREVGVIAIRVLAGGALSGSGRRHENATETVERITPGSTFAQEVENSHRFAFLIEEGVVDSLVEASIRFALSCDGVSTALVGISDMEQLEQALGFAGKGPLPGDALDRLPAVWADFA